MFIGNLIKYRWLIAGAAVILAIGGAWVHGYMKGVASVKLNLMTETNKTLTEDKKDADKVKSKVDRFKDPELDRYLCGLGIVRGNHGCG